MAPPRYAKPTAKKAAGADYTPPELARFLAERLAEQLAEVLAERPPAGPLRVLDPAVGDGELLLQAAAALRARGLESLQLVGWDPDARALRAAKQRLAPLSLPLDLRRGDFLDQEGSSAFDLIIANPPYVRTQVLGAERAQALAARHGLRGRVDLYQAFLVSLGAHLAPAGVAGVITSNRYLSVRSGEATRGWLWANLRPSHVWDLGDSRCFEAAVLPAITVFLGPSIPPRRPKMTCVYSAPEAEGAVSRDTLFDALGDDGPVTLSDGRSFEVRQGQLATSDDGEDVWRLSNPEIEGWLAAVAANTWRSFGELGKIRVGVKTTADAVFIREDWSELPGGEPELLRPLLTHHVARPYRAEAPTRRVLYPHRVVEGRREAVDLAEHPRALAYLEGHRPRLEGRRYVAEAGRRWYELWVPHDPEAWARPKLVFRDISEAPMCWLDLDGGVVNGDCYWLSPEEGGETGDSEVSDALWLALAIGNSDFVGEFYDRRFNNKLYAGRRRFITQYVQHFPVLDPAAAGSREIVRLVKRAWAAPEGAGALRGELEGLVRAGFGVE